MLKIYTVSDTETEVMNTITEYEDRFGVDIQANKEETMNLLFVIGYRGDMKGDKLISSVLIDGSELWERYAIDEDSTDTNSLSLSEFVGEWVDRYFDGNTDKERTYAYEKVMKIIEDHCKKNNIEID
jgi:hypothetical protein